jgi:hypothetical protein
MTKILKQAVHLLFCSCQPTSCGLTQSSATVPTVPFSADFYSTYLLPCTGRSETVGLWVETMYANHLK